MKFSGLNTSLRQVVELLASLGYEPELTLGSSGAMTRARPERRFYLKIGVAAFPRLLPPPVPTWNPGNFLDSSISSWRCRWYFTVALSSFPRMFTANARVRIARVLPALQLVVGILLIVRGLDLGIFFLSPKGFHVTGHAHPGGLVQ